MDTALASAVMNPQTRSDLLGLPAELRIWIYEYYFALHKSEFALSESEAKKQDVPLGSNPRVPHQLRMASRLAYTDTQEVHAQALLEAMPITHFAVDVTNMTAARLKQIRNKVEPQIELYQSISVEFELNGYSANISLTPKPLAGVWKNHHASWDVDKSPGSASLPQFRSSLTLGMVRLSANQPGWSLHGKIGEKEVDRKKDMLKAGLRFVLEACREGIDLT